MDPQHRVSHIIKNLGSFEKSVVESVNNLFMIVFYKDDEFMDCYLNGVEKDSNCFLREDIVDFWVNYFTFENEDDALTIYEVDIARLEKRLYKELVENIMSKLVDDGILLMCWNAEKEEIVWERVNKK